MNFFNKIWPKICVIFLLKNKNLGKITIYKVNPIVIKRIFV